MCNFQISFKQIPVKKTCEWEYNILHFSGHVSTSANTPAKEVVEPPLKFEDIVDATTYDKMRPPRPGGELHINCWINGGPK